jgi:uncharacterized protein
MSRKKAKVQAAAGRPVASRASAAQKKSAPPVRHPAQSSAPPTVSVRWLLWALGGVLAAAILCAWGTLCLLFWQGSWQLLYHPSATVARTPAAAGLPFDSISLAPTDAGLPQLTGWWIPAASGARFGRYTVLYLHSQDGNLGGAVDRLAQLHAGGVNVFAFDYRGYGRSQFSRPSEAHWLQDTGWAFEYLTGTRHIAPDTIVLAGSGLGANLALEFAASHPLFAGVILESPLEDATGAVFNDARARFIPARLFLRDRYNMHAAAASLRIASLWFMPVSGASVNGPAKGPAAFQTVSARKMLVWLPPGEKADPAFADALARWLDDLASH